MKNTIPAPNAEYSLEQMDGEILLYSTTQTRTIYLNQTASMIWQLCDGTRSQKEIVEVLTEAFPDTENLEQDIAACLEQLCADGAVSLEAVG